MRSFPIALVALLGLALSAPVPAAAQGTGADAAAPTKRRRAARPKREPSASQMAARERQKKCGVEWREAKAKGQTGAMKWPQYWSKCNARLKGNTA